MKSGTLRVSLCILALLISANAAYFWLDPHGRQTLSAELDQALSYEKARGFRFRTFVAADGSLHHFSFFVPHDLRPDERLPLILYLNGQGKNGDDGVAPLIDGFGPPIWESRGRFPFVLVCPQCPEDKSWSSDEEVVQLAFDIADHIQEEYHTDPDRVILSGLSSGGAGVWSIAARYPERFAAIAPISAGPTSSQLQQIAAARLPVWSFHVGQDGEALVNTCRRGQADMLKLGRSERFSEITALTTSGDMYLHDAWSFAYRDSALLQWMWNQNRADRTKEDRPFQLHSFNNPQLQSGSDNPGESSEIETVVNSTGATTLSTGIAAGPAGECHLEFLAGDRIDRCGVAFLTEAETADSGVTLEVRTGDAPDSGGLFTTGDRIQLHSANPIPEHAFEPGGWNELRLSWDHAGFHAELNGWPLLHAESPNIIPNNSVIAISATGSPEARADWRYLRTRISNRSTDSPPSTPTAVTPTVPDAVDREWTIDDIAAAWDERAARCPSVRLQWTQQDDGIAGWSRFRAAIGIPSAAEEPVPDDTLILTSDRVKHTAPWFYRRTRVSQRQGLVGDVQIPDYMRLLNNRFRPPGDQFCAPAALTSWRSNTERRDVVTTKGANDSRGTLSETTAISDSRVGDMEELFSRAPLQALRPGARMAGQIDLTRCRIVPGNPWINGSRTVVLESNGAEEENSDFRRRYWLDPQREFSVLRSATWQKRRLREQTDIDYVEDAECGWRPVAWTVVSRPLPAKSTSPSRFYPGNERLFHHASARVTEWQTGPTPSEDESQPQFPPGTAYFDQTNTRWMRQTDDAEAAPLDDAVIMQLVSGDPLAPSTWFDLPWAVGVPVIAGVIWIAWRWQTRRTRLISSSAGQLDIAQANSRGHNE